MTQATAQPGFTASWLLSGDRAGATRGLADIVRGIAGKSLLGQISEQALTALQEEIATVTYGLLNLDLGQLLQSGWRLHATLTAAARATVDNPTGTELVELARHRIAVAHQPSIDLQLNGVTVATIELELALQIEIDGLIGTVRQGRLMELRIGRCVIEGTLRCESVRLAAARTDIDPGLIVGLGRGLPLLHAA